MFRNLLKKTFGDTSTRTLKSIKGYVDQINALEPAMEKLSDAEFSRRTAQFRERLQQATAQPKQVLAQLWEERERAADATGRARVDFEIKRQQREIRQIEEDVLDQILPEAFALVREASQRTIGLRHYDVQLIGGIVLHRGQIAEMKTGEGKTLVATLPLYINALTGRGVHLVTPNDYLSKVGVQWMGPIYHLLGLSVAVIQSSASDPNRGSYLFDPTYQSADDRFQHLRPILRREAYQADITYGTNNEFGFDYLRDNMVQDLSQCVQRQLYYAIVDEVDNILIDEARTPLIISGAAEESSNWYTTFAQLVPRLRPSSSKEAADGDYVVEEKERTVTLTESGIEKMQSWLNINNLYSPEHFELTPYLDNALRAHVLYKRDKDYIVRDGEVVIVDEFTGRLMEGRRYSEGLHQAIEAKEGVKVQRESLTLATITFQNYFRMYDKLAGMTGTAETEKEEFSKIYNLDVVVIPTHVPVIRVDHPDQVYKTGRAKFSAVIEEISDCYQRKQPVLVGTVAIETSEYLSRLLERRGIPHNVLNAKQHEREAVIIAQAGRPGAVTIATNMAGRGVDILLGGNPEGIARDQLRRAGYDLTQLPPGVWEQALAEAKAQCARDREVVLQAGGLRVIGTERHEARRIDNQLRGRAGRQGDPGESRFYVALDDDLMRRFGGERVAGLMDRLGIEEDVPIEHSMVSKSIESAQTRVEGYNFDIRKHVLEYDDVVNKQREVIYDQRRRILRSTRLRDNLLDMVASQIQRLVQSFAGSEDSDERDLAGLHAAVGAIMPLPKQMTAESWLGLTAPEIVEQLIAYAEELYDRRAEANGRELWRQLATEDMTLAALHSHQDAFLTTLYEAIVRRLGAEPTAEQATLPFKQLDAQTQAAVQAGIIDGAALYRDRMVLLRAVDERWVRHLTDLDSLREGIGLRAVAQVNPLVAYKKEAHEMYVDLTSAIENDVVHALFKVDVVRQQQPVRRMVQTNRNGGDSGERRPERRSSPELGRNDPCWCGSGKKYKHCHMRADLEGGGAPQAAPPVAGKAPAPAGKASVATGSGRPAAASSKQVTRKRRSR